MKTISELHMIFESAVCPDINIRWEPKKNVVVIEQGGQEIWLPDDDVSEIARTLNNWADEGLPEKQP